MLLVKTKIGPSEIDGIGLFADQFIPRGTLVWELVPALDIEVAVEGLPEVRFGLDLEGTKLLWA